MTCYVCEKLTEGPAILEGEGSARLPQEIEGNTETALMGEGFLVYLKRQDSYYFPLKKN